MILLCCGEFRNSQKSADQVIDNALLKPSNELSENNKGKKKWVSKWNTKEIKKNWINNNKK